ncbi:MAG TPA: hypothetical protein VMV69_19645 [Pirellulales bacterium]|nr:hypothetical protein [Pirellulales bacterium]
MRHAALANSLASEAAYITSSHGKIEEARELLALVERLCRNCEALGEESPEYRGTMVNYDIGRFRLSIAEGKVGNATKHLMDIVANLRALSKTGDFELKVRAKMLLAKYRLISQVCDAAGWHATSGELVAHLYKTDDICAVINVALGIERVAESISHSLSQAEIDSLRKAAEGVTKIGAGKPILLWLAADGYSACAWASLPPGPVWSLKADKRKPAKPDLTNALEIMREAVELATNGLADDRETINAPRVGQSLTMLLAEVLDPKGARKIWSLFPRLASPETVAAP